MILNKLHGDFPLRVPPGYQNRINTNNPEDPFLKQVLPSVEEDRDMPDKTIIPFRYGLAEIYSGYLSRH